MRLSYLDNSRLATRTAEHKPLSAAYQAAQAALDKARQELAAAQKNMADTKQRLDGAVAKLATLGWDPRFGARPVKRVIQREVQDRLADAILAGDILPDQNAVLDVHNGEFVLEAGAESRANRSAG